MGCVVIAGDFCPQKRVAHLFEIGCFDKVLGEVRNVISKYDYSIVNLECPITEGDVSPIEKLGGNLQCSEKGIEGLKWAGFDCVTLANNHFYDFEEAGVKTTLQACSKYDIDTVGGGENITEASKVLYKKINDKTIAIINCCEHEFSIANSRAGGSNPLNPVQQFYSIQQARTNADFVIMIIHGGHEHFQLPSLRMIETYRFFIDSGADTVINHHQHCFSGYEIYNNRPIFYGLGNFCFDGNLSGKEIWYEGYMVKLDVEKPLSFEIIPYIQCKDEPAIVFLSPTAYDSRIKGINDIISEPSRIENEIKKYFNSSSAYYDDILEPSNNRYYLALKHREWLPSMIKKKRLLKALNYIECESHRDKLLYCLHNK